MTLEKEWWEKEASNGRIINVPKWSDEPKASWHFVFICSFLLGLQQQGIFRVPGSQVEVNDIKNSFERGRYPSQACVHRKPGWLLYVLEQQCAGAGLYQHFFPSLD